LLGVATAALLTPTRRHHGTVRFEYAHATRYDGVAAADRFVGVTAFRF
jgi:hypothetical protein